MQLIPTNLIKSFKFLINNQRLSFLVTFCPCCCSPQSCHAAKQPANVSLNPVTPSSDAVGIAATRTRSIPARSTRPPLLRPSAEKSRTAKILFDAVPRESLRAGRVASASFIHPVQTGDADMDVGIFICI